MKKPAFIIALCAVVLSCSQNKTKQLIKFNGTALGTFYSISYYDDKNRNFQSEIDSLFKVFNHTLSIYDSSSLISKINNNETQEPDAWFTYVFNRAKDIHKKTNGCFDPTVAPLVNAWGFGFKNAENITPQLIDSLLDFVGFDKINLTDGQIIKDDARIMLDFNAIAKGYCADIAAKFLLENGINSYLVEIGGEIASKGQKPDDSLWKIGIEEPTQNATDEQTVMQIIQLQNKALATSGNYRKYFEKNGKRYAHTIDPKTGHPSENNLLSATVLADDCITADAFATAFMVMGLEDAFQYAQKDSLIEAFFIYTDEHNMMKTKSTKGFEKYME